MSARFDVIYQNGGATIGAHFCREWDETGCYGTNPDCLRPPDMPSPIGIIIAEISRMSSIGTPCLCLIVSA